MTNIKIMDVTVAHVEWQDDVVKINSSGGLLPDNYSLKLAITKNELQPLFDNIKQKDIVDIPIFKVSYIKFKKSNLSKGVKKLLAKTGRFTTTINKCKFV